jgi:hypothetical protein
MSVNLKILMSHDLVCALGELGGAACRYSNMEDVSARNQVRPKLAVAAVAFTIQLAIEAGRDPAEMRALERELVDAVIG